MKNKLSIILICFFIVLNGCFLNDGAPDNHFEKNIPPPVGTAVSNNVEEEEDGEAVTEGEEEEDEGENQEPAPIVCGDGVCRIGAETVWNCPDDCLADEEAAGSTEAAPLPPPEIVAFGITSCAEPGATLQMNWEVRNATRIRITPSNYSIPVPGWRSCSSLTCIGDLDLQIIWAGTYSYTLMAEGANGERITQTISTTLAPMQLTSQFAQIFNATAEGLTIKDAALSDESAYLATSTGLYRVDLATAETVPLSLPVGEGGGINATDIAAVAVTEGNFATIFALTEDGHLYESNDRSETWRSPHHMHVPLFGEMNAVSATVNDETGNEFIVGTSRGIIEGDVGGGFDQNYSSTTAPILRGLATPDQGYFAMSGSRLYQSVQAGGPWSSWVATSPGFFLYPNDTVLATASTGLKKWNGSEWVNFSFNGSLATTKLASYSFPESETENFMGWEGWFVLAGSQVWAQPGSGLWRRATLSGSIPMNIKGFFEIAGRSFIWSPTGLYEWKVEETSQACPAQ